MCKIGLGDIVPPLFRRNLLPLFMKEKLKEIYRAPGPIYFLKRFPSNFDRFPILSMPVLYVVYGFKTRKLLGPSK